VAAAARDLDAGVTLAAADLTTVDLPATLVPPGAYSDGAEVPVLTTLTPFAAGEVVTDTRLARPSGPLTASVAPGMVAFTLAADQGPPGIAAGDRVDVYATYATARPYTAVVADDVAVLGVDRAASGLGGGGGVGALTVAVDPFTAQELARADATAVLAVAVRGFVPVTIAPPSTPSPTAAPEP
jgi:Flp pilus assembly protein CpaB